jgi:hypothetical protein
MSSAAHRFSHCFVDESIHEAAGFAVTSMVFADQHFQDRVSEALCEAGISVREEEYKSSARMDKDARMRSARRAIMQLVSAAARVAVVVGPFQRMHLGRQALQALQSTLMRNGVRREGLSVYFDREVFPSQSEATRLHRMLHGLRDVTIYAHQDSKQVLGIQAADAVAHSFGQILKAAASGEDKIVDIGGPDTGYLPETAAPLAWELLMTLRYPLFTRLVVCGDEEYPIECDPVVLDPMNDDEVSFRQSPVLLGWGVQVAPESEPDLRITVEQALGKIWLGCVH